MFARKKARFRIVAKAGFFMDSHKCVLIGYNIPIELWFLVNRARQQVGPPIGLTLPMDGKERIILRRADLLTRAGSRETITQLGYLLTLAAMPKVGRVWRRDWPDKVRPKRR